MSVCFPVKEWFNNVCVDLTTSCQVCSGTFIIIYESKGDFQTISSSLDTNHGRKRNNNKKAYWDAKVINIIWSFKVLHSGVWLCILYCDCAIIHY